MANDLRAYWEISNLKFGMWPLLSAAASRLIPKVAEALIESPADVEFGLEKLQPTIATEIAFGRRRKPTSRWQCCQCNSVFDARDGSSVPDNWWSPMYNRTQPKPWTCPRCQSWSTTIPHTGTDGESIHAGRRRRPGRNWVCGPCNRKFEISCDPNQVPRKWWMPSNNAGGKAPWACPNCGTSVLTFPVE